MDTHLLIHNIGFSLSAAAGLALALFLLFNSKRTTTSIMMTLSALSLVVFIGSHVIGVNIADPILSKDILMLNLSTFLVGAFLVHSVLAYLGKDRSRWWVIVAMYAIAIGCIAWFIARPDQFLLPSVPKMYFPNYYNPGPFHWIRIAYLHIVCVGYVCIELMVAYSASTDNILKSQYKYLLFTVIATSSIGFIPNFLVYNIMVDPLWATLFLVIAAALLIYASLAYELFDIKIIAKQAFIYAIGISVVGGAIAFLDYGARYVKNAYPDFPIWIGPFSSAVLIIILAGIIWRKLREEELLKYEFVTTVTHKFRTPLTHIKWAAENLSPKIASPEDRVQLSYIQSANEKLVELTSLLMNISETENNDYEYRLGHASVSKLVEEVAAGLSEQFAIKKLQTTVEVTPDLYANIDESRIRFIIQTFIENAVHYTPIEGKILVSLKRLNKDVVFSVTDSGIGIAQSELPHLFHKFYRGHTARLTDTEGMGIGLYMSKEIINRHHGKIWAYSPGANKGSVFGFAVKEEK
jgi:signal transduction histidine kinase